MDTESVESIIAKPYEVEIWRNGINLRLRSYAELSQAELYASWWKDQINRAKASLNRVERYSTFMIFVFRYDVYDDPYWGTEIHSLILDSDKTEWLEQWEGEK